MIDDLLSSLGICLCMGALYFIDIAIRAPSYV